MLQNKYKFISQEVLLNLPRQGAQTYTIESTNFINYSRAIGCTCSKNISLTITSDEERPYTRILNIKVNHYTFKFSDSSYALQDITKKITTLYSQVILRISFQGKIIAIDNKEALQHAWRETKKYIVSKYKGNQIQRFIYKTDALFESEKEIIKDLSLYHNFGALVKDMYEKYDSDSFKTLHQELSTKYGKTIVKEKLILQTLKNTGEIQLQLEGNYPNNNEFVSINGTYNFESENESWLNHAIILITEKYESKTYYSTIKINKSQ